MLFYNLPCSALADGKLTEVVEHMGVVVEHPQSKSTQPMFASRCPALYIQIFRMKHMVSVPFLPPSTFLVNIISLSDCLQLLDRVLDRK